MTKIYFFFPKKMLNSMSQPALQSRYITINSAISPSISHIPLISFTDHIIAYQMFYNYISEYISETFFSSSAKPCLISAGAVISMPSP